MNALDVALIAARAMLSEAFEGMEKARENLNPNYPVWHGRFIQSQQFVNYLENVIEQESKGGVTIAESLALMKGANHDL